MISEARSSPDWIRGRSGGAKSSNEAAFVI
jgi:hypothetical protein